MLLGRQLVRQVESLAAMSETGSVEAVPQELELLVKKTDGGLRVQFGYEQARRGEDSRRLQVRGFFGHCLAQRVLCKGDVILEVNGTAIDAVEDVLAVMKAHKGSEIAIKVRRSSGSHSRVEESSVDMEELQVSVPKTNGDLRIEFDEVHVGGVSRLFIKAALSQSNAERQGLVRKGDELLMLNDSDMANGSLQTIIEVLKEDLSEYVTITLRRGHGVNLQELALSRDRPRSQQRGRPVPGVVTSKRGAEKQEFTTPHTKAMKALSSTAAAAAVSESPKKLQSMSSSQSPRASSTFGVASGSPVQGSLVKTSLLDTSLEEYSATDSDTATAARNAPVLAVPILVAPGGSNATDEDAEHAELYPELSLETQIDFEPMSLEEQVLTLVETLQEHVKMLGDENQVVADDMFALGMALMALGTDLERAHDVLERAQEIMKKLRRPEDPVNEQVVDVHYALGQCYISMRDYEQANTVLLEVLEARQALDMGQGREEVHTILEAGAQHIETRSVVSMMSRDSLPQLPAGIGASRDVLRMRLLDGQTLDSTLIYCDMSRAAIEAGLENEALRLCEQTLMLRRAKFGADHPAAAETLVVYSEALCAARLYEEAIPVLQEALSISAATQGQETGLVADILSSMGMVLHAQGKLEDAEETYAKALEVYRCLSDRESTKTASVFANLSDLYKDKGDLPLAIRCQEDCVAALDELYGVDHVRTVQARARLGVLMKTFGKWEQKEGNELIRGSLAVLRNTPKKRMRGALGQFLLEIEDEMSSVGELGEGSYMLASIEPSQMGSSDAWDDDRDDTTPKEEMKRDPSNIFILSLAAQVTSTAISSGYIKHHERHHQQQPVVVVAPSPREEEKKDESAPAEVKFPDASMGVDKQLMEMKQAVKDANRRLVAAEGSAKRDKERQEKALDAARAQTKDIQDKVKAEKAAMQAAKKAEDAAHASKEDGSDLREKYGLSDEDPALSPATVEALSACDYMSDRVMLMMRMGNYEKATGLLEECYTTRHKHLEGKPITLNTLYLLGESMRQQGSLHRAGKLLSNCLKLYTEKHGRISELSAACITGLAEIARAKGNLERSQKLHDECLQIRIQVKGHAEITLECLRRLSIQRWMIPEATDYAKKSNDLLKRIFAGKRCAELAGGIFGRAEVMLLKGDIDGCRNPLEQVLANRRVTLADRHPLVAESLLTMGHLLLVNGSLEEAERRYEQSWEMRKDFYADDGVMIMEMDCLRGKMMRMLGRYPQAVPLLEVTVERQKKLIALHSTGEFQLADTQFELGEAFRDLGKYDEARRNYSAALQARRKELGTEPNPVLAINILSLADTARRVGRIADASKLITKGVETMKGAVAETHYSWVQALMYQADMQLSSKEYSEALMTIETAQGIMTEHFPQDDLHHWAGWLQNTQGECLRAMDDGDEALKVLQSALTVRKMSFADTHLLVLETMNNIAITLAWRNRAYSRRLKMLTAVMELMEKKSDDGESRLYPSFPDEDFQTALAMLRKCIRQMEEQGLGMHPMTTNMRGNIGLIRKTLNDEKFKFVSKLTKAYRGLFKAAEDQKEVNEVRAADEAAVELGLLRAKARELQKKKDDAEVAASHALAAGETAPPSSPGKASGGAVGSPNKKNDKKAASPDKATKKSADDDEDVTAAEVEAAALAARALDPAVIDSLQDIIDRHYLDPALVTLEKAVDALERERYTPQHPWMAKFSSALVSDGRPDELQVVVEISKDGLTLLRQGQYSDAEAKFEVAMEVVVEFMGDSADPQPAQAEVLFYMAENYSQQGRLADALAKYSAAYAIWLQVFGEESEEVTSVIYGKAELCLTNGLFEEARFEHERAFEIRKRLLGVDNMSTIRSAVAISNVCRMLGDYAAAHAKARDACEKLNKIEGKQRLENAEYIAAGNACLARCLLAQGASKEAREAMTAAMELAKLEFGESHPLVANILCGLADVSTAQGMIHDAKHLISKAFKLRIKFFGEKRIDPNEGKDEKGNDLPEWEKPEPALIYEREEVPPHALIADALCAKAINLISLDEFGEATESLLRSAQLMRERLSGAQTPYVCRIAYLQGHMLYMRGKYFPALDKLGLTRRMQLQILGEKHPDFGDTLFLMATIQSRMSKLLDSEQLLDECMKNRMELHRDKFHKKRADDDAKANKGKKDKALSRKEAEAAEANKSTLTEKTVLLHNHTPYHPKLLECNVLAAYLQKYRGSFIDCKALCEDTVDAYKETLGAAHPTTAHAALLLGETLRDLGALEMSYAMIEKALAARSSSLHENHHLVAECLNALAETMRVQGKYLESKKINEQALGIRRAMLGKYHYDTARSLCSLGQNFHDLGMYPSADTLFNKALQLSRRCATSEDHRLVADCIHARGENLIALGRYPEATVELARGKAIRVKLFGEMHPDVAVSIFAESDLNFLLGNNEAAIHGYDDTLAIRKTLFGSMSREVASSLNGIGQALVAQAKFGEARNMLDRSLLMRKRLLGAEHPDMGDSLFALAVIDYDMGRIEQATVTMERCLKTWKVALGARHPKNATALCALADMYRSMGSLNAAIDATTDSLKIRKASLGDEHPRTVESLFSYSMNLMMMGIYDDPQAIGKSVDNAKFENEEDGDYGRAPEPEKKKKKPKVVEGEGEGEDEDEEGDDVADDDSIKSITSRDLEGLGGDKQEGGGGPHGRRGDADPTMKFASTLLVRVLQSRSSYFGPDHWSVLEAQHFLALCHLESGKLQEALELITDTVFLRQKVLGEDHPLTAQSIVALAEILRAQSRVYPNGKVGDKDGNATAGEDDEGAGGPPAKSGRLRKAGPTLVDQLASVIDKEHWKESASGALTAAADFSAMDKKPMKLALPQMGYMGYQFPAEKRLGRLGGNASRFANLKEDDARWLLDTAHKIYVASYGAVSSNLRFTMHIAHCKGELERSRRNTGASRGLHETTLEHRRHLLPSGHPDIAKSLFAIAETYRVENKFKAAEPLHEMARDMRIQVYGINHPLVADSLNALALLDFAKGNYMEADTLYKQVREVRTNFFGKYHLAVAQTLNNIAGLAHINGDKDEAETMYRACLDVKKRVYGSDHPDYATALNNLGLLLKAKGVLTEAEKLYNKALDVQKNHFGNEHPDVASTLNNIAALLFAQGDVIKAQQLYRESITVKRVCLGVDHPSVAAALNNLAGLLFHTKSFEEAREHYEDSLRIRTKAFGGDHPLVAESLNNIALMFATEGKLEDARMLYSRALIIKTNVFGEEHEVVASAMASLAFVLQSLGKVSDARRLLDDTLEIRERVLGEEHPDTLATADAVERLRVKDVLSHGEDPHSKPTDDLVEDSFFAGMDGVVH